VVSGTLVAACLGFYGAGSSLASRLCSMADKGLVVRVMRDEHHSSSATAMFRLHHYDGEPGRVYEGR